LPREPVERAERRQLATRPDERFECHVDEIRRVVHRPRGRHDGIGCKMAPSGVEGLHPQVLANQLTMPVEGARLGE